MEPNTSPDLQARPRAAVSVLAVTALLTILLGLYQWYALYDMRTSGHAPGCAISEKIDCASVWNSPLASLVHAKTGLPFAGWGVVWGVITLALALMQLRRMQKAQPSDDVVPALRLTTGAGALLSLGLLIYSITLGVFCPTCVLFYVLVMIAAYLAFARLRAPQSNWGGAALQSGGWLLVAFGALLYPGLHTPKHDLVDAAMTALPGAAVGNTDLAADPLANFIKTLTPQLQQIMSDARAQYRTTPIVANAVAGDRLIYGDSSAPVHLIDWIDIRCPHCRNLEEALNEIRNATPASSWSEESRHFPLDSECNHALRRSDGSGVACLSAKLLICLSGSPRNNVVRSALFANQRELTVDRVWQIAAPDAGQRAALEKCVASPGTAAALQRDIELANQFGIEGTPLVVINGRQAPAFPPFIYAMIIAAGDSNAAGFRLLPPPRPEALQH